MIFVHVAGTDDGDDNDGDHGDTDRKGLFYCRPQISNAIVYDDEMNLTVNIFATTFKVMVICARLGQHEQAGKRCWLMAVAAYR